jgi:predicted O-methyltransferase YrrM
MMNINKLEYGNIFESILFIINPKIIVEFGILDGYSLNYFLNNTTNETKIYAYDIFDKFSGNHAKTSIIDKYKLHDNVTINYGDFYNQYIDMSDNYIDILHIDIANTGDTYTKAFEFYLNKLTKNGIMILEGGSISRDNVYWMNKYNKPKIIPVLEKYKDKINIKIIGDFPSITLVTKI